MLLEGKNLFPLTYIEARLIGYFMDSFHYIYSNRTRKGQLTKLRGSLTSSGQYYTLAGVAYRADALAGDARKHPAWAKETSPNILDQIRSSDSRLSAQDSTLDRNYAVSMDLAIKGRAVIIATVQGDKLIFGTNPRMHIGEKSWKSEMERLAKLNSGTKFVALQLVSSVISGGIRWE